jgi:hypothetical protein
MMMVVYDTDVFSQDSMQHFFIYSANEELILCILQISTGLIVIVRMLLVTKRGNPTLMNTRIKSMKN